MPVNSRVEKSCPLKRHHAVGGHHALCLGKPHGSQEMLPLADPLALSPRSCCTPFKPCWHPAADSWPSWPGRTIGRRVVTYVPLYTHILGFLTYICWQACARKQLLTLLVALHSSLGPVLSSRSHQAWTKLWQPSAERRRDGVKSKGDKAGRDLCLALRVQMCKILACGMMG